MKKFLFIWSVAAMLIAATSACEKTDEPLENENGENTEAPEKPGDSSGEDGEPVTINPSVEGDAKFFVGKWIGDGPTGRTKNVGEWVFNSDGTFTWAYDYYRGYYSYGTWRYLPDKKMLITEAATTGTNQNSWNWAIEDFGDDQWIGTCLNDIDGTYTYRRGEVNEMTLSEVRIIDYPNDGFLVTDTIKNYFLNGASIKTGFCYGSSTQSDPATFQKAYASEITRIGTKDHYGNYNPDGITKVNISGLAPDGKYKICPFLEFEDGRTLYGDIYRAICIQKPTIVETVYMGERPNKYGYIYLWAAKDLCEDGTWRDPLNETKSVSSTLHGFDNALQNLGNGWGLPKLSLVYKYNERYDEYDPKYIMKYYNNYIGDVFCYCVAAMNNDTNGNTLYFNWDHYYDHYYDKPKYLNYLAISDYSQLNVMDIYGNRMDYAPIVMCANYDTSNKRIVASINSLRGNHHMHKDYAYSFRCRPVYSVEAKW